MQNVNKAIFGAITYIFSYLSGCINEMIIVLSILMMFDYITGVVLSKKENRFNRDIGAWGAVKKFFYIMIIVSAYLADISVNHFIQKIGLDFNTYGSLGFAVTFYLIGNEGVSLYTNWVKLGLPAPRFISSIYSNFKVMADASISKEVKKEGEEK